jgi:hypothetical protein
MELETQLADFADRIQSACGPYINFDEVQQWPKGRLDELLGMGVVIPTTHSTKINCTECNNMDCPPIEPSIETLPGATEPVGLFICTKEGGGGLIKIPLERFKRWEIVACELIELGYPAGYEVFWDQGNDLYIPLKDAVNMADNDAITVRVLSKQLQDPEFPVHRMHKGKRCMVCIPEFRKWLQYTQSSISDAAIDKYLEGTKVRKTATKKKNIPPRD